MNETRNSQKELIVQDGTSWAEVWVAIDSLAAPVGSGCSEAHFKIKLRGLCQASVLFEMLFARRVCLLTGLTYSSGGTELRSDRYTADTQKTLQDAANAGQHCGVPQ